MTAFFFLFLVNNDCMLFVRDCETLLVVNITLTPISLVATSDNFHREQGAHSHEKGCCVEND